LSLMTNETRYNDEELSKLTNYRVIEHISSGSEGSVFLCECDLFLNNKNQVAIKMIYNYGESTRSIIERHENEFFTLTQSISHNNIIKIFAYFIARPTEKMISYIPEDIKIKLMESNFGTKEEKIRSSMIVVFEYIPNNLEDFLKNDYKSFSITRLLSICKGIGEGLNHLFKQKIVHRDMKLKNILIDENECPVIFEFGFAERLKENFTCKMSDLHVPGGNPAHLSPDVLNSFYEQKRHKNREIEINYSKQPSFEFGVICFEILFGGTHPLGDYPPIFYRKNLINPLQIEFDRRVKLDTKEIPIEVRDAITNLLKNDPNERPFIEDILHFFG